MDAFKLLCRSTNISRKPSHTPRPSGGEANNPQLFGKDFNTRSNAVGHESRKRKREEDGRRQQLDRELDFFGDYKNESQLDLSDHDDDEQDAEEGATEAIQEQHNFEEEEGLPEGECRRLLKSHKIKITRMWPEQEGHKGGTTAKRKSRNVNGKLNNETSTKGKKRNLDVVPQPLRSFSMLRTRYGIDSRLARNIEAQGFKIPTEVQLGAVPLLLKSKNHTPVDEPDVDLLAVAPTGSGKTLAFLIPVLNDILGQKLAPGKSKDDTNGTGLTAIILAPTKELATQIINEARKLSLGLDIKVTHTRKGMRFSISNGRSAEQNEAENSEGYSNDSDTERAATEPTSRTAAAQILVATPGGLVNAITANVSNKSALDTVRYLILDEADVLLDQMFRKKTLEIWSACTNRDLRVSLWSATMGSNIEELAKTTILEHRKNTRNHSTSPSRGPTAPAHIVRLVVGLKDSAIPSVQHRLIYAATEAGKLLAMRQLLRPTHAAGPNSTPQIQPPFLVFTQTIPRAIALASELRYDIPTHTAAASSGAAPTDRLAVLHADLPPAARRTVMARFRAGTIWVLITTDLLARGVDFRGANAIVNYDLPTSGAAYVHRAGRTGRAGRAGGVALTLYAEEDVPALRGIVNIIRTAEAARGAGAAAGLHDWLLRALPKTSKEAKKRMRRRGIEARRAVPDRETAARRGGARARISTKSGYERQLENRRRGAAEAAAARRGREDDGDDGGFEGFSDGDAERVE